MKTEWRNPLYPSERHSFAGFNRTKARKTLPGKLAVGSSTFDIPPISPWRVYPHFPPVLQSLNSHGGRCLRLFEARAVRPHTRSDGGEHPCLRYDESWGMQRGTLSKRGLSAPLFPKKKIFFVVLHSSLHAGGHQVKMSPLTVMLRYVGK